MIPNPRSKLPTLCALLSLFLVGSATAQPGPIPLKEGDVVAPFLTPEICRAKAFKKDGKTNVQIIVRALRVTERPPGDEEARAWLYIWDELESLILGEQINAFTSDHKKMSEEELLKALAKETSAVCIRRKHKEDPKIPEDYFKSMFRKDIVVLVFDAKYWLRKD